MKRIASILVLGFSIGFSVPGDTGAAADGAGDLDHLVCYRIKDSMTKPARLDLLARLRAEFSVPDCKLDIDRKDNEVNAEYCVPASSRNVEAPDHDPNALGAPLSDDYICYRIECKAKGKPPQQIVTDAFGQRQVAFGKAARVCVPATKEPVPCGQISREKGAPVCGGVCPSGTACQSEGGRKNGSCVCAPVPCKGSPDDADVCGGTCPDPADECVANADDRCACAPRGCGLDPASNQCGGPCADSGQECLPTTGGGCECVTPAGGCGLDPDSGMCGGECPPDLFCLPPLDGGSGCLCRDFGGFF